MDLLNRFPRVLDLLEALRRQIRIICVFVRVPLQCELAVMHVPAPHVVDLGQDILPWQKAFLAAFHPLHTQQQAQMAAWTANPELMLQVDTPWLGI